MRRAKTLSRAAALFLAAAMTVTSIAPAAFAEDVDVLDVTDLEAGDTGSDEFGYNDSSADLSGSNDDAGAVEGGEVLEEGAVIDDSVGENLTEGSDLGEDAFEVGAAAWSLDNISNDDLFDDPTNETLDVTGDTVSEGQQDLAQAGTPPQVTGLVIELRNKDQSSDYLLWNMVEYVHHYEIHISDSDGVIYGHNISDCPDKERYADEMKGYERIPGYNISGLDGLLGWTADGQEAKDGDKQKKCFEPGKTYSIKVRAVFQNTTEAAAEAAQEGNGNEGAQEEDAQVGQRNNANVSTWTAGPWSDSVNYTAPARKDPKAITGLSWVKQEKVDYYYDEDENHDLAYFTYNEQLQGEIVWSIHTDPDCKEEPVREGSYDTDRTVKLFIDVQNIPAGTYYLRAYNMVGGYFVDESGNIVNNSDYPPEDQKTPLYAKTSFTVTHETVTSPATTGFALLSETNEGFYFTVNPRESADDTIYLQRVEGEVFPDNYPEWINRFANNDNFGKFVAYVSKDGLAAGKTYSFRAITKRKNAADFGTPSDVVKITKAQKPEAISNLAKKSRSTDGYVISFSGNFIPGTNVAPSTNGIQDIEVWVSTDPSFANRTEKGDGVTDVYNCVDNNPRSFIYKRNLDFDFNDHTFIFPERYLEPGKTYYIKARTVINAQQYIVEGEQIKPNPQYRDNTDYATEYGEFSNTLSLTAVLPKAQVYTYAVGKTTIT